MKRASNGARRSGWTLIELLIVIAIIVVIMGLAAGYLFVDNTQKSQRAADRLSGWLLFTKQWAKRDNKATGLRLIAPDPAAPTLVTKVQYVQQPEAIYGTSCTTKVAGNPNISVVGLPPTQPPSPGDYLEVNGGGTVYLVTAVALDPTDPAKRTYTVALGQDANAAFDATTNFRFLRDPQPVSSQDIVTLPEGVVLDLDPRRSLDVPVRQQGGQVFYEVLFNPDGSVGARGAAGKTIYLWLRDPDASNLTDRTPLLIAIPTRTGFISTHPVAPFDPSKPYPAAGNDPHFNARSGRSSGM